MGYYIGIDIGASFIKGALFDQKKLKVKNIIKIITPISTLKQKNNQDSIRFEVDCDLYEKPVRKIISELLAVENNVNGIVFSTQMHGMVLVDSDLKQLTPFIGWQDERMYEKFSRNMTWLDFMISKLKNVDTSKTGIKLRSGLMGCTLFWLKEKGLLKKYKNAKTLFLGDYIGAKLTKGKLLVHPTNACGSALFNTEKNCWDEEILKALSIDKSFLPEIASTDKVVGNFNVKGRKIPVFVSVGDMQAAIVGSLVGLSEINEVCINIGTGSQVSSISAKFKTGDYDIRSYFDNKYLNTITFIPAGRALNVIIKFIEDIGEKVFNKTDIDVWGKLLNFKNKKESGELISDISFFKNGISTKVKGGIFDITEKNLTIENLFFSVLDRMAENYFIAYKKLALQADRVICAGGLGRKIEPLRLLIKKKFSKTVLLAPFEEETLAGLFILSLVDNGKFSTVRDASNFIKRNKLKFENEA
jgi:sugar (pentulose or hexulose) kinase